MARLRDSTYTNAMYTDGYDPYAVRAVVGAGDGSINQALCFSGANSLSRCNGLVRDLSKRVCFQDGCTDNLAEFRNTVYSPFCNDGDSGSPVYNRNESNNRANVKGILIGGSGSTCWYHKYSTINSHLNVEVYTG